MDLEGLTGGVRFGDDGRRENFTLSVVEMTVNSDIVKVNAALCKFSSLCKTMVISRKNVISCLFEFFFNPKIQIGEWSDSDRFRTVPAKFQRLPAVPEYEKNRTYSVTTYLASYFKLKL